MQSHTKRTDMIYNADLMPRERQVLFALNEFLSMGEIKPSQKLVSRMCGLSLATVKRALTDLKSRKVITVCNQNKNHLGTVANRYVIDFEALEELSRNVVKVTRVGVQNLKPDLDHLPLFDESEEEDLQSSTPLAQNELPLAQNELTPLAQNEPQRILEGLNTLSESNNADNYDLERFSKLNEEKKNRVVHNAFSLAKHFLEIWPRASHLNPSKKEIEQAADWIREYGLEKSKRMVKRSVAYLQHHFPEAGGFGSANYHRQAIADAVDRDLAYQRHQEALNRKMRQHEEQQAAVDDPEQQAKLAELLKEELVSNPNNRFARMAIENNKRNE